MKLLILVTLIAAGVAASSNELLLARTEPSKTAAFTVDTEKDFHFELGRGGGMDVPAKNSREHEKPLWQSVK